MRTSIVSLLRTLVLSSLLAAGLFGLAPAAQAALSGCRADPVFLISDGTVLDVSVSIETAVSNVSEIHYVVHGPRGTHLVTALPTPTLGFKGLETITYIADAAPNQYMTDTLVRTPGTRVRATSYTIFAGNSLLTLNLSKMLSLSAQYRTVEGFSGQHLVATLYK